MSIWPDQVPAKPGKVHLPAVSTKHNITFSHSRTCCTWRHLLQTTGIFGVKRGYPQEFLRGTPSAPRWTHPEGKENSGQEEDGNNVRNLSRGRLRCLPDLFGGEEADQQGTVHDGSNPS